jgi:hypothetical protein
MKLALFAALAIALCALFAWWTVARRRSRARTMERLMATVRVLGIHLGREWDFVTIENAEIVLKNGDRVIRIPALTAIEAVESAAAGDVGEKVRWLVNHATLRQQSEKDA